MVRWKGWTGHWCKSLRHWLTQKSNWKEPLNKLVYDYNYKQLWCDLLFTILYSPWEITQTSSWYVFGLHSKSAFNDQHEYVEKWKEGIEEVYGIAKQNAQKAAERSKKYYNTKEVQCCNPVNMSWLRIWHPGEDQPICSWENIVHIVVSPVGSDLPIYEVKPERGKGRSKGLHRNFLMPCDQSPVDTTGAPQKGPKKTGKEAPAWNANSGIWGRQWKWVWATLITTPSFHRVNGKKRPSWWIRDGYCT